VATLRETTNETVLSGTESMSAAQAVRIGGAADSIVVVGQRRPVAAIGGGTAHAAQMANAMRTLAIVEDTRPEFWMYRIGAPPFADTAAGTWGLHAVNALASTFDGSGIRIAILDTGISLAHPDFLGRRVITARFVADETADDVQGHGTHVAGTACGRAAARSNVPRYGVAPGAELYVAKVLNNRGAGREHDILAGIEWALEQQCDIINMSLGRAAGVDEGHDPAYEARGRDALAQGALIIAAAGNDSDRRFRHIAPVSHPANAPSIMAVAAVGADDRIADFSCGGVGLGQVDIAGPGVGVFSSVPAPHFYEKMPGTSMAAPHVAGVAALWAQSDRALRGQALWDALVKHARPLPNLPPRDVGAGLVQAP
jgi:subtilisin